MFGKILVYTLLALIIISLFSALALLFKKDSQDGKRDQVVKALTIRVGLSVSLFLLLMAGYYFGIIPQQGLR